MHDCGKMFCEWDVVTLGDFGNFRKILECNGIVVVWFLNLFMWWSGIESSSLLNSSLYEHRKPCRFWRVSAWLVAFSMRRSGGLNSVSHEIRLCTNAVHICVVFVNDYGFL